MSAEEFNTSDLFYPSLYTDGGVYPDWDDYTADSVSGATEAEGSWISSLCRQAARYYVAVVIVFGLFGNVGCLICYRQSVELKRYRSTGYLMALALSDLTFLICLSFVWLKSVGIDWQDKQFVCQTSVYASNASIFLSAWYVMALTAEMAFAVHRPYSAYAAAVEANKTVVIRIFVVSMLGFAVNSWTLALTQSGTTIVIDPESLSLVNEDGQVEASSEEYDQLASLMTNDPILNDTHFFPPLSYDLGCHISSDNQLLHQAFVLFDVVMTYSIPLLVTLLLNCYIGYKLVEAGRRRRYMSQRRMLCRGMREILNRRNPLGQQGSSLPMALLNESLSKRRRDAQQLDGRPLTPSALDRVNTGSGGKSTRHFRQSSRYRETTISSLLIAKSMAYLLFNTPSCTHRIWSMLKRQAASQEQQAAIKPDSSESWIQLVIYMLFYTQFSINFLLYSYHAYARRKCKTGSNGKGFFKPLP